MQDLVSIIMPSYNCAEYVEQAIRSVQEQTYRNWEILFIDDCSKDDTIRIVNKIRENDSRIRLFQNANNSGAAVSRNIALKEAKGRWVAFLDSDDLWEPTKLEKQINFMERNGYKFSYTAYLEIDEDGTPSGIKVSGPQRVTKSGMFAYCWPGCLTVMYDAHAIGVIQVIDIRKNNDYALWLKVCKKADCYLLSEYLARYRRGRNGSISTQKYSTLIKWHFKLWHEAENRNVVFSVFFTAINLICAIYKKIRYVRYA